ncbi:MAG: lipopolysaccharide biosynthesis protein [Eisenbergiella sp.]
MSINSKESITANMLWRLFERFGAQGVTFIVSIILARLLEPEIYGTVALVTVFTSILQVFIDSGLGNSLIQKKDADDLDFSTVFYFNIAFCIVLYILLWIVAPFIAQLYKNSSLKDIIRVLGLTIIISGIKNIQQSYVAKYMLFKKFFYSTLGGTIGAAIIGILMAYNGFGVWALVGQNLFNTFVDTCILWISVEWRPKKSFSFTRLKALVSYGWKLLAAKLLDTVYEDIRTLIIGKMYSTDDLAYYDRGRQFPMLAVSNVNIAIDSVLFPSMAMEQTDLSRVRAMTSRAVKMASYVVFPMMTGMAVCAEPLIRIILTDKWIECVPYLRIFCFGLALNPILIANLNAIKAIGRSDLYLRLEMIRKAIGLITLVAFMWFGVKAIAYSYLLNCILNIFVNSWPNRKILGYGYLQQLKDIIPSLVISGIMGGIIFFIPQIGLNDWVTLLLQIVGGGAIYIGLSVVFKVESLFYILSIVKNSKIRK